MTDALLNTDLAEKHRNEQITAYVASLYMQVMEQRKDSADRSMQFEIPPGDIKILRFNAKDKDDIRRCLHILLPECSLRYTILPVKNSLDTNMTYSKEFLVIDWS
jgi:hypothetical protein